MSITIQGLTQRQYQIADMIWNCDSQEAVDQLIRCMPPEFRKEAVSVHQLMLAAVFDQHQEITEDVKTIIDRICS